MSRSDLNGPIVVIIDNDHRRVRTLQAAFESAGFRARLFTTSDSALRYVVEAAPDVIVSSANTLGLDARDVLEQTRAKLGDKAPRFVVLGAARAGATDGTGIEFARQMGDASVDAIVGAVKEMTGYVAPPPPPVVVKAAPSRPAPAPPPPPRPMQIMKPWRGA